MNRANKNIYIAAIGLLSPLACGLNDTTLALRNNSSAIAPLDIFFIKPPRPLPVGQIHNLSESSLPRTHHLANEAAKQAMEGYDHAPDAIIIGTTTGGILNTEEFLASGETAPEHYKHHGLTTVAEEIAKKVQCTGPALTVSTACSSGTVAISMATKMLQTGRAQWVLAGGADSLCKLTYFGFHSLQLVDPEGSRPYDLNRQGMSVAEGAALLLLSTIKPEQPLGQVLGCGLSCDAYHPASPHPEGKGAASAMQHAMEDSKFPIRDIDYINLHGTGTPDNDLAESKAVRAIFKNPPPLSSIKGATGHGLAASGAIEAAIATLCIQHSFVPGNTGCQQPDPECIISPILQTENQSISAVLSNSFGFGGNNACLVIAKADRFSSPAQTSEHVPVSILGKACITGAGHTKESLEKFSNNESLAGVLDHNEISSHLPARKVRRLKRFSRIALALAAAAQQDSGLAHSPHSVFMGSGWGALSETYDFLEKLRSSDEQFPSPIDFVGSVHNSAAGQIAIMHGATGANITSSGGDYSFEQALLAAETFLSTDKNANEAFVLAADEFHPQFSPLLDASIEGDTIAADGGGGFHLCKKAIPGKISVQLCLYEQATENSSKQMIAALGGTQALQDKCAMILAGIPAGQSGEGKRQLDDFMQASNLNTPVINYREFTGEFASASSVAAVVACHLLETSQIASDKNILVLGFGKNITAMEFSIQ